MNDQLKVLPDHVAILIEQKRLAMEAKQKQEELEKHEERDAFIQSGRELLRASITESLKAVPEWLHEYDVTESTWNDDSLESIGQRPKTMSDLDLIFHIPGLAPIKFRFDLDQCKWCSAQSYTNWREYGPELPKLGFNNNSYFRSDLEFILIEAEQELESFVLAQQEYQEKIAQVQFHEEQEAKRQEEIDARRASEQTIRDTEERELFNVFKDDPVAIHLLKAFLMIHQERGMFESQIEDANETMYSIEERWSRRAEDLRRQANDAQRRAEEEHDRVRDIQNDLDDAEAKLKKAQRGW